MRSFAHWLRPKRSLGRKRKQAKSWPLNQIIRIQYLFWFPQSPWAGDKKEPSIEFSDL
jgi:hypothetical protein